MTSQGISRLIENPRGMDTAPNFATFFKLSRIYLYKANSKE